MSRSTHELHPLQAPRRGNDKKAEWWCEGRESCQWKKGGDEKKRIKKKIFFLLLEINNSFSPPRLLHPHSLPKTNKGQRQ